MSRVRCLVAIACAVVVGASGVTTALPRVCAAPDLPACQQLRPREVGASVTGTPGGRPANSQPAGEPAVASSSGAATRCSRV